ncbi:ABC transporter ATP-binding protein [Fibrobacter succinogenes]|uniref:ABC transporter ATP-binding protein n=1 Tax=Fibrobacter succinogenes TaxID=833 RepID=UPI0015655EA7|nr:ABC transporter ATP-binding protein [Fibrobacter succinogenes]
MSTFSKLSKYMGSRKPLFPLALILSALSAIAGLVPFLLMWLIVREILSGGDMTNIRIFDYSIGAVLASVASVLLYFAALACSHLVAFRLEGDLRRFAMKKLMTAPLGFFDKNPTGKLRKIIDDNAAITHTFVAHQMPDISSTILIPIIALVMMFVFDWRLGLATLVPIAYAIFILSTLGRKGTKFMERYMQSLEEMNSEAVEYVRGIPVVKVFQQTIYSFKNFYKTIETYHQMVTAYSNSWKVPYCIYTTLVNGFVLFLVPVAILIIGNGDDVKLTIVNMMIYVLVTPLFSQCVMRSMYLSNATNQAGIAIDRINDIARTKDLEVCENPVPMQGFDVEFKNVNFTYPGTEAQVLHNVSFAVPTGSTVALVGASGGGKSTVAKLLPRFFDVDSGEITIGGISVKQIDPKELMKNISFVFQNTRLFKMSILDNVRYGTPDATLEQVNEALDLAQCREIIDKLPNGIHTVIGSKGTYLSGGEQQRVVLARAILKNAPIVVLDEATAFADPENERLIQEALRKLAKGKTVLMIAHRLTSIVNADEILVVENGEIVERGTHNELIGKSGVYAKMWAEYQQSTTWTLDNAKNGENVGGENV